MHLYCQERLELIKGKLQKMSPAPSAAHQEMVGDLFVRLREQYHGRNDLVVFVSPFDVYLSDDTVVQPDITVCMKSQISKRGCEGAPYLVVEVVSPSSKVYDEERKQDLYKEFGIKEYWLAYPDTGKIQKIVF